MFLTAIWVVSVAQKQGKKIKVSRDFFLQRHFMAWVALPSKVVEHL